MKFAVHTVLLFAIFYTLLLAIFYTNITRAQNLDPIQIAPNIPSSYESYYGSENEVISDNDQLQNDYTSGLVYSSDIQEGIMSFQYRGCPDNTVSISTVPGLTRIFLKGNSTDSSI